jgi:hypothetical protein
VGGDAGIDQRSRRDTSSGVAVLSLRSIQTRRVRNGSEQPSIRQEPSRSQPELESARPRSGRRDGALRRILSSGYRRNAGKQFERSVPPNVIVSLRGRSPANGRFRNRDLPYDCSRGVGAIDCPAQMRHRPSRTPGGDDGLPEEHTKTRNHDNPKDKSPSVGVENLVVVGGRPVGVVHAKLLGRPPSESQPHQTLIKNS